MTPDRHSLSNETFAARVIEWKGTYGWLDPLEPIDHPEIGRHQGRIFVHQDDIITPNRVDEEYDNNNSQTNNNNSRNGKWNENAKWKYQKGDKKTSKGQGKNQPAPKMLRRGVICEFSLYQDAQGLGAENVVTRQVVRLLLPVAEGKRIFSDVGEGVPDFEDRHRVSLRAFEWFNLDGSPGLLPFLVEIWGKPLNIVSAVQELKNSISYYNLDFLVPQSRVWLLDLAKLHKLSGCNFQISNLCAIDDPMPCFPLSCNGTDEQLKKAVLALIDQICDPC